MTKFSLKLTVMHVQESVLHVQSKQSKLTENNYFWSHFLWSHFLSKQRLKMNEHGDWYWLHFSTTTNPISSNPVLADSSLDNGCSDQILL